MSTDYERFVKTVFEAFRDLIFGAREIAATLFGLFLTAGILAAVLLLLWIRRGGLTRLRGVGFGTYRRLVDKWPWRDS